MIKCADRIGIWSVGFCGGMKTGDSGEKPSEQGIELRPQWWEASAPTTAPPLHPNLIFLQEYFL